MRRRPSAEQATPDRLATSFGPGLAVEDRGSLGKDRALLITTPDAPGGFYPAIEHRVELNPPGASGGEVGVWQDGQQVFTQRGMTHRTTDQLRIGGVFSSTFFGGGGFCVSPNFMPPVGGSAVDPLAPPDDDANHCQAASVPAPS